MYGFSESYRRVCKRAVYFIKRVLYLCNKNMHLKNHRTFAKTGPMFRKKPCNSVDKERLLAGSHFSIYT